MEELFGIPITQLMIALLVLFGIGTALTAAFALRNRVVFNVAVRNIPRRRAQTSLIVLGLMLATLLFSASFSTGETMTHSIRLLLLRGIGEVDITARPESRDVSGRATYFDQAVFETIRRELDAEPLVEGVAPLVREVAPVIAPASRQSEAAVSIMGMSTGHMAGFDQLIAPDGGVLDIDGLDTGQAYVSEEAADKLSVQRGDSVQVFLGSVPSALEIVDVYQSGAYPAGQLSMVLPLERLQALTGNSGGITHVLITNVGGRIEGAEHTDEVVSRLEPLLEGTGLEASPVKQDALDDAEESGQSIATIFLVFGQFSVAAGILLIFLIFIMLAAERKRELGIIRAVGTQRSHVIRMFVYEGAIYSLMAAAVGSFLGVLIGLLMVSIIGAAFAGEGFDLAFAFSWRNLVVAYTMGMVITFVVVAVSSWRVSRLNIIRAVRDLPEPPMNRRSAGWLVVTILLPVVGLALSALGWQTEQAFFFSIGTSLLIIGIPLIARRLGLRDRLAYTAAGLGLVIWWLLPYEVLESVLPEFEQGIEMFFLSGLMVVLGGVWVVIYNSDLLVRATTLLLGRVQNLSPILNMAMAYPMHNRLRTGLTLAMFSLVVFTLTVMGFVISANDSLLNDTEGVSGGYHIRASSSPNNPVRDMHTALNTADGVSPGDFEAIGSFTGARVDMKQEGSEKEPVDWFIRGIDPGYSDSVTYELALTADEYSSSREAWQALQNTPNTVIVDDFMVPSRTDFNVGGSTAEFRLEGFFSSDEELPEVYIAMADPRTGNEARMRVIGVLKPGSFYSAGVMTSQASLNAFLGQTAPPLSYMFRLYDPALAGDKTKALEASFLENGLQAESIEQELEEGARINRMLNTLLQGFMSLGLIVGIAALGVIAARSVVERRQQIGVLRAIGFQKGMVLLTFLLESSFVALVGVVLGMALGTILSWNLVNEIAKDIDGFEFVVPWTNLVSVFVISYAAALLTTLIPARQAASVYPADALRFE